jgi:hypothetical protein
VRYFGSNSGNKAAVTAVRLYQILIGYAARHQTISYLDLARLIGWKSGRPLGKPLGYLMFWCQKNKLPPITAIVVDRNSGIPGTGFTAATAGKVPRAQQEVFKKDWYALYAPTAKELEATHP